MIDTEVRWGMFSDKGNTAVQMIFDRCLELAPDLTDIELWQYAYSRLEQLSRNANMSEATDTAVRGSLWDQLIDAYAIRNLDQADYKFFVGLHELDFDTIVSTYDLVTA